MAVLTAARRAPLWLAAPVLAIAATVSAGCGAAAPRATSPGSPAGAGVPAARAATPPVFAGTLVPARSGAAWPVGGVLVRDRTAAAAVAPAAGPGVGWGAQRPRRLGLLHGVAGRPAAGGVAGAAVRWPRPARGRGRGQLRAEPR